MTILDKFAARRLYHRIAGRYDGWLLSFRLLGLDRWRDQLIDDPRLSPGDELFDLYCGTGEILARLAQAVGRTRQVIGIDLSEAMLEIARAKVSSARLMSVELIQDDVEALEVPPSASAVPSTFGREMVSGYDAMIRRCEQVLPAGARLGLLGIKFPERWPDFLITALEPLVRGFGATREYREFRPWASAKNYMKQLLYEERLADAVYSSMAITR